MKATEFTSRMSRGQAVLTLIWLPVHCLVLPLLCGVLLALGYLDELTANLLIYAVGALVLVPVLWRFFRRDFDALCDRPLRLALFVVGGYWFSSFGESAVALALDALSLSGSGMNNESVIAMAKSSFGPTAAMAVFLAPIVEESIFRGGIFGLLRRRSRLLAYAVSIVLFSLYHVWQGALVEPRQLWFLLQYIPASFALAYVYEQTDSIWGCIFMHMLSNGVAMAALHAL